VPCVAAGALPYCVLERLHRWTCRAGAGTLQNQS
jgi:hypothetical protein